jgi:hypothetical protein
MIVYSGGFQSAVKVRIVREGHAEEVSHQSEFGDCLLHTWNALRANGTSPEFQIRFVCLKKVTSEFLEFLLKFTRCRNDGARHHNGVTTAAWTESVKAGI